jgi:hypothetical protein
MSWKLFKVNMLLYMNNPRGVVTYAQYAAKLALEYDMCMRRGGQLINKNPIATGNVPLMTQLMIVAHTTALTKQTPRQHAFLKDVGNAVKGYWTGATLLPFPTPLIPAPGSAQNIIANSAMVTSPGTWPNVPFEIPTTSCLTFLDSMVLFMQIHLLTIKGMYMTTSLYPSAPAPIPGPGVVQFTGYSIPNIPFPALKLGGGRAPNGQSAADFGNDGNFGNLNGSTFGGNAVPFNPGQQGEESEGIDNQLRSTLSSGGTLDSNLDAILESETQKNKLGRKRFFTEADLLVADLIDTKRENRPFQKSLQQIRKELEDERRRCCVDCD